MRFVVICILLALLAGTIYVSHYGWVSAGDVTMPAWGWLMMGLGIFFTVVVGSGLMILIFYSSRAGYDEPPHIEYDESETPTGSARRPRRHKRQRNKVTRTH
jgi:Ni/Fe-hydrogenase subunit HybB-like protein